MKRNGHILVDKTAEYLHAVLGLACEIEGTGGQKIKLPYYLKAGNQFVECFIEGHKCLLMVTDELPDGATLAKRVDEINRITETMVVLVLENIDAVRRRVLIANRISFVVPGKQDSGALAKLVCFYYNLCDVGGAIKNLVIDALNIYNESDSWETKIKLVNKCNATWAYDAETENKLLKSLGGGYVRFAYPRGWANLDINEHNTVLIGYLKEKGHYISKVEERDGQYYVTFKHS